MVTDFRWVRGRKMPCSLGVLSSRVLAPFSWLHQYQGHWMCNRLYTSVLLLPWWQCVALFLVVSLVLQAGVPREQRWASDLVWDVSPPLGWTYIESWLTKITAPSLAEAVTAGVLLALKGKGPIYRAGWGLSFGYSPSVHSARKWLLMVVINYLRIMKYGENTFISAFI